MGEKLGTVRRADLTDGVRGVRVVEDGDGGRRTTRGRDRGGCGSELGLVGVNDGLRFRI